MRDDLPVTSPSAIDALVPRLALRWLATPRRERAIRVDGSLLFADISGFTRLSERLAARGRVGAEEVVSLVEDVLTAIIAELDDRDGDVLVFAGDALVALFEGHDGPERATRSAAAIRGWFATRGSVATSVGRVVLRVSIGVATGPVDLVFAGGDDELGLFVAGRTATTVVRMERLATAGEILVDGPTASVLDPAWLGEPREGGRLLRRVAGAGAPAGPLVPAVPAPVRPPLPDVDADPLVPAPIRRFLAGGPEALESEHRLATVAFLLVGDLDARLATDRAGVVADLDALYRAASVAAARRRVVVLGTDLTTDGVTLFLAAGVPAATGEDEERMLRTLGEILAIPEAGRLALRAGVNRGPVFAGHVGAPHRRTYTAMGDATNLAARIAARAAPGELLATANVLTASAVEFATVALEAFTPKGKRDPVVPYRVGAPVGTHSRAPVRLPLAGRHEELAALDRALEAAIRGEGGVVVISGEPGSGKSRLVQEFLPADRIAARCIARFTPADEDTPYGGLRHALRDLAGIPDDAEPPIAGERLAEWLDDVAPALRPWLPLLAIPFAAAVPPTPQVTGLAPAFRRERLHRAMADLLGVALPAPAVIVLEDLHWADEASYALAASLAEAPAARSWVVLALGRPGARTIGGANAVRLDLEGLDREAAIHLALAAAGSPLSDADVAVIVDRAAGNPLFVRELAVVAAEQGTVEALPDRLESLLASRIDRLDGRGRALLRRAAVMGRTVDLELLDEMLVGEDHVARDLAAWAALDEFVAWVGPTRLRFRHDLVRDAAYEGLSYARRRVLHGKLALAIERRAGQDTDEVAAVLATHFARGGALEPAFRYGRRAGDVARSRYANVDAAVLYRRALESAAGLRTVPPEEVAAVAEALGDVGELAGRYDEALDGYARARALARLKTPPGDAEVADAEGTDTTAAGGPAAGGATADGLALGRIARKTGVVCERAARYVAALSWYSRALRYLGDAGGRETEALRIRLALDRAGIRFRQGRYGACVRAALPAAEAAARIGERPLLAHAYYLLHAAYGDLGSPEVARYRDLALPIYEEIGDLVGQGNVLNNLGIEAYFEGRWDDALDLYARSKAAKSAAGDVANAATQSNNEAEILSDQGRFEEAEALLQDALRVWGAAGYEIGIALVTSNLGRVAARAGRHEDGLRLLADAAERFGRIRAAGYVGETRARLAECLALAARCDEAEAVARETLVAVRREAETSVLEAQLERTIGWCSLVRGEPDPARAAFDTSLAVARRLKAGFEVALTLRARLAIPVAATTAGGAIDRARDAAEAAGLLAGLGVIAVAEPPFAGGPATLEATAGR